MAGWGTAEWGSSDWGSAGVLTEQFTAFSEVANLSFSGSLAFVLFRSLVATLSQDGNLSSVFEGPSKYLNAALGFSGSLSFVVHHSLAANLNVSGQVQPSLEQPFSAHLSMSGELSASLRAPSVGFIPIV